MGTSRDESARPWLLGSGMVVAAIAVVKLLVHLYAGRHYGYFVDELYYMACGQHLAWGYVDQPPLIAFFAWAVHHVLGDSLPALRLLPALAGAGQVLLTGLVARELGGGRFAQGFAALATLVAPGFLAFDNFFSMNAFEPLFWTGCAYVLIRIVKTGDQRLWLWFGVLAGVGLENKHSMLTFGFALIVGVLLTPERKAFRARWIWLAGLVALLLFLPNPVVEHPAPFPVPGGSGEHTARESTTCGRPFRSCWPPAAWNGNGGWHVPACSGSSRPGAR